MSEFSDSLEHKKVNEILEGLNNPEVREEMDDLHLDEQVKLLASIFDLLSTVDIASNTSNTSNAHGSKHIVENFENLMESLDYEKVKEILEKKADE